MNNKAFNSVTFRVLAAATLPALFACVALTSYYLHKRTEESRVFLETRGRQLARDIAAMSEYALISGNGDYLEDTIATLVREPQIHSIIVFDNKGRVFLSNPDATENGIDEPRELMRFSNPAYRLVKDIDTFDISEDINLDAGRETDTDARREPIGKVEIRVSPHVLQHRRAEIIRSGIVIGLIVMALSVLIGLLYSRNLLAPIKSIVASVRQLRKGDYSARLRSTRPDELGSLAGDIDKLASQLQTSKEEIGRKMIELTESRENADRANATKSMFLARVSHELRDPLTAVVGNLEILANTQASEYQQRAIRLAEKNTEFLLRQIDDILEFSLLEAGRYRIDPQYIDPADVVEVVAHSARPKAEATRLSFSIEFWPDEQVRGCRIKTDPVRLQQILTNLIDNAIKFTHQGEVHALLSLKAMDSTTAQLVIEVTDTGVGIPRENLDHIFEMFEQVQPPVSREHGGVGIGLSITKSIVEALDGDIAVESEPLKGARFTVTLTADYQSEPDMDTETAAAGESREREKVERILLVEDNPDNQRVISTLLGNIDIEVDIANHGIEGFHLFQSKQYDIVFIDCFMPQMDGFEFTRKIREWERQTGANNKTMLIGLTAGAHRENIEHCYTVGMDDVITKPFYRIDIYKRVLGLRKARRFLDRVQHT